MTPLLVGCETVRSSSSQPTVRLTCPPLVSYDRDTQRRAAEELDKLPPGSALRSITNDYSRHRDICRAIERERRKSAER